MYGGPIVATADGERKVQMTADLRSLIVSRHARVGLLGDPATASEAWVVLHGYGMLARGILHWFRAAAAADRVLIAPEGLSRFYAEMSAARRVVGASWTTREDLQHELDDQYYYLERVVAEYLRPDIPLHVHGFSQGVSTGVRWCARAPRRIVRLVCWAGMLPEDLSVDGLKRALGAEPLHLVVGNRDTRVSPERVEADAARLRAAGMEGVVHRFAGGHRIDDALLREFAGLPRG